MDGAERMAYDQSGWRRCILAVTSCSDLDAETHAASRRIDGRNLLCLSIDDSPLTALLQLGSETRLYGLFKMVYVDAASSVMLAEAQPDSDCTYAFAKWQR